MDGWIAYKLRILHHIAHCVPATLLWVVGVIRLSIIEIADLGEGLGFSQYDLAAWDLVAVLIFPTASTLGTPSSTSKSTPLLRCHLVAMKLPVPASYSCPLAGGFSLHSATTNGATYSGFIAATSSSGLTVRVILVPADGARAFTTMLYLAPSRAMVLLKPTMPHFERYVSRS